MKPTEAMNTAASQFQLDYTYIAVLIVFVGFCISMWIFATRKLSNFNRDNAKTKKQVETEISQDIYKKATAPLILAVSTYISSEVKFSFSADEQEVIEKYEAAKSNCLDPEMPGFIDISNFSDNINYDQKVTELLESHGVILQRTKYYKVAKRCLSLLKNFTYLPILMFLASGVAHALVSFSPYLKTYIGPYVETLFVIGLLTLLPGVISGVQYFRFVGKLDSTEIESV